MNDPRIGIGAGYSLWFIPDRQSPLFQEINQLIIDFASANKTPAFIPHVTLINDIDLPENEMVARTHAVADTLTPLSLPLRELDSCDHYYQRLFMRIEVTVELQAARQLTEKTMDVAYPTYDPHCSFVYGMVTPEQITPLRQELVENHSHIFGNALQATAIQLWRTIGPFDEWRLIKTYPLEA